jgi:cobalamin biosynthesis protein CbiD
VLDVIAGATQFPVSAGKTIYIGLLEDTSVGEVEIPMPAGQVLEVVVERRRLRVSASRLPTTC